MKGHALRVRGGGIGLTVVSQVARRHHGSVELRNIARQSETVARAVVHLPVRQRTAKHRWLAALGFIADRP